MCTGVKSGCLVAVSRFCYLKTFSFERFERDYETFIIQNEYIAYRQRRMKYKRGKYLWKNAHKFTQTKQGINKLKANI